MQINEDNFLTETKRPLYVVPTLVFLSEIKGTQGKLIPTNAEVSVSSGTGS